MPNIAEMKQIFQYTPIDQAILLIGIHGIGKSEIVKQIFEKDDYVVITFFLGQMADAGDVIGLPDKTEVEIRYRDKVVKQKITEFCPPKWWPRDYTAKVVIFMDEFNRGKPEVYQCIFDMVLNRKLNGLDLPEHTRIIAAMNPLGDEYDYDVEELDPALFDRFNVYAFNPTVDEWLDYAMTSKHHKWVIGFINKNRQMLDPPKKIKDRQSGVVYPSRRSWTRVSKILNAHPDINNVDDGSLFKTMLFGIVGVGATAEFSTYIMEQSKNISGAKIVTSWDDSCEIEIKSLSNQELVKMNKEIAIYLEGQEKVLFDMGKKSAERYAHNVSKYLHCVPPEIAAAFYEQLTEAQNNNKTWQDKLLSNDNTGLVQWFVSVLNGETKHEKKVKQMIQESEIDEQDHFSDDDDEESDDDFFKRLGLK